jgi:hypothetical protein
MQEKPKSCAAWRSRCCIGAFPPARTCELGIWGDYLAITRSYSAATHTGSVKPTAPPQRVKVDESLRPVPLSGPEKPRIDSLRTLTPLDQFSTCAEVGNPDGHSRGFQMTLDMPSASRPGPRVVATGAVRRPSFTSIVRAPKEEASKAVARTYDASYARGSRPHQPASSKGAPRAPGCCEPVTPRKQSSCLGSRPGDAPTGSTGVSYES